MSFRKTQKVEKAEVLSPKKHTVISNVLKTAGKKSVGDLDETEKQELEEKLRDQTSRYLNEDN